MRDLTMPPGLLTLTANVISSVGWLGAVVAYLAVAIAGLTSANPEMVRAAYLVTALIGWLVIVPLTFAALLGARPRTEPEDRAADRRAVAGHGPGRSDNRAIASAL